MEAQQTVITVERGGGEAAFLHPTQCVLLEVDRAGVRITPYVALDVRTDEVEPVLGVGPGLERLPAPCAAGRPVRGTGTAIGRRRTCVRCRTRAAAVACVPPSGRPPVAGTATANRLDGARLDVLGDRALGDADRAAELHLTDAALGDQAANEALARPEHFAGLGHGQEAVRHSRAPPAWCGWCAGSGGRQGVLRFGARALGPLLGGGSAWPDVRQAAPGLRGADPLEEGQGRDP